MSSASGLWGSGMSRFLPSNNAMRPGQPSSGDEPESQLAISNGMGAYPSWDSSGTGCSVGGMHEHNAVSWRVPIRLTPDRGLVAAASACDEEEYEDLGAPMTRRTAFVRLGLFETCRLNLACSQKLK